MKIDNDIEIELLRETKDEISKISKGTAARRLNLGRDMCAICLAQVTSAARADGGRRKLERERKKAVSRKCHGEAAKICRKA
jgi:hypothetical protein